MVLTEENKVDAYPAATLEGDLATSTDAVFIEKNYYDIKSACIVTSQKQQDGLLMFLTIMAILRITITRIILLRIVKRYIN